MGEKYYLVSLKHTMPRHKYVSLWGPDNRGYVWPMPWAGLYTAEQIAEDQRYYNNGTDTIAVPEGVVKALCSMPAVGDIDGDVGPCVRRDAKNLAILKAAAFKLPHPTQGTQQQMSEQWAFFESQEKLDKHMESLQPYNQSSAPHPSDMVAELREHGEAWLAPYRGAPRDQWSSREDAVNETVMAWACMDAADEIERLRAACQEARDFIRKWDGDSKIIERLDRALYRATKEK